MSEDKKRVGRPAISEEEAYLHVRVMPEERDVWQQVAAKDGRTMSSWVRHALNQAAAKAASQSD